MVGVHAHQNLALLTKTILVHYVYNVLVTNFFTGNETVMSTAVYKIKFDISSALAREI